MRSSYQELMALVRREIEDRDASAILALLQELRGLRRVFEAERDLLEAVIRRVERAHRASG